MMPEGVEQLIDHQAMADLIEFLHQPDAALLRQAMPR